MTKEAYFEMCEQLQEEPVESEIPVEISDFPELIQTCLLIYSKLKDNWDPTVGKYMGKDYTIVFELFDLYSVDSVDERITLLDVMQTIDITRINISADKVKAELSKQKSKTPR